MNRIVELETRVRTSTIDNLHNTDKSVWFDCDTLDVTCYKLPGELVSSWEEFEDCV